MEFEKDISLLKDKQTCKKLEINFKRNKKQDNGDELDQLADDFIFEDCKDEYWNPEEFSLLYGSPIWDQATDHQKILLNQLYWVGYYSQIISAEIATIFLNQTAAAGLYGMEDFRLVCDTLDFESYQERAHINAFKKVSEQVEEKLFGERIFTYPMKNFATQTMIFQDTNKLKDAWKKFQLHCFSYLSSSNAFIASQYLTVRGLRTLKGKIVQHKLSQYYMEHSDQDNAPIPAKISYHHFLDESYHFNSSTIIGHDVVRSLKKPTAFEKHVANMAISGCQKDHSNFNICVNGIFWYEPALFSRIYQILTSKAFGLEKGNALELMERSFCQENNGVYESFRTHKEARVSYKQYVAELDFLNETNRNMSILDGVTIDKYLQVNRKAFSQFMNAV